MYPINLFEAMVSINHYLASAEHLYLTICNIAEILKLNDEPSHDRKPTDGSLSRQHPMTPCLLFPRLQ
jgi:hypothetical protein